MDKPGLLVPLKSNVERRDEKEEDGAQMSSVKSDRER